MQPIYQTIHEPLNGNCFQACVASIFELPLDAVPHFMENCAGHKWTQEQWDAVLKFAEDHGRRAFWVDWPEEPEFCKMLAESDLHYIAIGKSKAGDWGHCVVMHKGKLAHDPSRSFGLDSEPWTYVGFEVTGGTLTERE